MLQIGITLQNFYKNMLVIFFYLTLYSLSLIHMEIFMIPLLTIKWDRAFHLSEYNDYLYAEIYSKVAK